MKTLFRTGVACVAFAASMGMATAAQAQDTASASAFAEILDAFALTRTPTCNLAQWCWQRAMPVP